MNLPGLITVAPDQTTLIDELANMMGESFLEELWTAELLSALDGPDAESVEARRLEVSRAIMREDFTLGAPCQCCYALEDRAACAGGYLKSDLQGKVWDDIETEAMLKLADGFLTLQETMQLREQMARMAPITVFDWEEDEAKRMDAPDFIHFYSLGVDRTRRGSGAFRRLMTPFFDYADEHGIPCFLETYSKPLEELYAHFGFETLHEYRDPAFTITERCMVRKPR